MYFLRFCSSRCRWHVPRYTPPVIYFCSTCSYSKYLPAHAARRATYCTSLTGLLWILYCSGSSRHSEVSQCWGLSVWVPLCFARTHTHTHTHTGGVSGSELRCDFLSAPKCSINTLAFLKPWQSRCCKLTRRSNFPSWNKSFLMYFF